MNWYIELMFTIVCTLFVVLGAMLLINYFRDRGKKVIRARIDYSKLAASYSEIYGSVTYSFLTDKNTKDNSNTVANAVTYALIFELASVIAWIKTPKSLEGDEGLPKIMSCRGEVKKKLEEFVLNELCGEVEK